MKKDKQLLVDVSDIKEIISEEINNYPEIIIETIEECSLGIDKLYWVYVKLKESKKEMSFGFQLDYQCLSNVTKAKRVVMFNVDMARMNLLANNNVNEIDGGINCYE